VKYEDEILKNEKRCHQSRDEADVFSVNPTLWSANKIVRQDFCFHKKEIRNSWKISSLWT
jgi:hypothetical protein